jgi:hypothetical protein
MQVLFFIMQLIGFVIVMLMSGILQVPMLIKQRKICNVVFYVGMVVFFVSSIIGIILIYGVNYGNYLG